jgi:hypothetical protein
MWLQDKRFIYINDVHRSRRFLTASQGCLIKCRVDWNLYVRACARARVWICAHASSSLKSRLHYTAGLYSRLYNRLYKSVVWAIMGCQSSNWVVTTSCGLGVGGCITIITITRLVTRHMSIALKQWIANLTFLIRATERQTDHRTGNANVHIMQPVGQTRLHNRLQSVTATALTAVRRDWPRRAGRNILITRILPKLM